MAYEGGISGLGVAVISGGALLAYAGFRGITPVQALRDIASGNPQAVQSRSADFSSVTGSTAASGGSVVQASTSSNSLVNAAMAFQADTYSQAKRWQPGYSDCSSFIGKSLKKIGITPPGASTTWSYLSSPQWKKIARSEAKAGDIAVNATHAAIFIDNTNGIGQQNPRRNVAIDTMDNLMAGTGSYTCLRYTPTTAKA